MLREREEREDPVRPINLFKSFICLAATALTACSAEPDVRNQTEFTREARPPQYVLLGFDGSKSLPFWEESRAFARDNDIKFTYFISGVYFLRSGTKSAYDPPNHAVGASAIGFGVSDDDIAARLEQVEAAHQEGHEIASHACGHFDGSGWSHDDWVSEHQSFDKLVFEAGANNAFEAPALSFEPRDVIGFRAPQLGRSSGLYTALAEHGLAYDTSRVNRMSYWPQKLNGVWDFPLAALEIAGSGKKTLSMDYNFYVAQSGGSSDPANKETYRQQMLDTYMAYFEHNYFGNRAPVDIGHHFSKWNGGAYWEAMKDFALKVCGLPEVKCVTYRDLVTFLEENTDKLEAYAAGSFNPMPRPPSAGDNVAEELSDDEISELLSEGEPAHSHDDE